ncbi:type II secretion system F family protein [Acetobacterium woodii]|nr:type II secretion system F family protein [Acetobacterium woodii]
MIGIVKGGMMNKPFIYKAKDQQGETITGTAMGRTSREIAMELQSQNLIVLEIKEQRRSESILDKTFYFRIRAVTEAELGQFCRQFQVLLKAGIPILKSLELIQAETKNKGFGSDLQGLCNRIQAGESLSMAMAFYPKTFPALLIFMVEAGEISGNLDEILLGMAEHYETEVKNRQQLQQTLFYPMILSVVFLVVLIFLITYVLPTFTGMFAVMNAELPAPTRFLLAISQAVMNGWPIMILVLLGSGVGGSYLLKNVTIATAKDWLVINLPLIGMLHYKRALARIATTMGMLLRSGIDLLTVLNRLEGVTANRYLKKELVKLRETVANGKSLGQGMAETDVFPSLFCQLVVIGETSGTLPDVLETLNLIYKDEVDNQIKLFNTSLEPLLLMVFGGMVLFILAAIMLPVFDIYAAYANM